MLVADFKAEISGDFEFFQGLSKITSSGANEPAKVNELGLTEGMKNDWWLNKNKITATDYLAIYSRMSKYLNLNMLITINIFRELRSYEYERVRIF